MARVRPFLARHRRATVTAVALAALALLTVAYLSAYRAAYSDATAVEVTISRPDGTMAYHANITNADKARRIQHMLNGALDLTIWQNVSTVRGMPTVTTLTSYTYDFRFAIAGIATQEFRTEQGGCLLQEATLGVSRAPFDEGRFNPLTAAGWSELLGISPALPDVPAST